MEIIGLICEYSPFHNGHLYHIQKIKEKYPDSLLVLCLNGNFLQRGQASVLKKEDKVKIALEHQIDLVIELPVLYGTQSADKFAYASTFLLNALKVQKIIFGSETTDLDHLRSLALKQLSDTFCFKNIKNQSYPENLNDAIQETEKIAPNDLLAISYIKAIIKNKFSLTYECIKRTNDYHDTKSNEAIISASNIRLKLKKGEDVTKYLPDHVVERIVSLDEKLLFNLLKFRILTEEKLEKYLDVQEGLNYKLKKEIVKSNNYEELLSRLKSRRYTYNRLQRMLCHLLLGISKEQADIPITYLHILGFSHRAKKYIKENKSSFLLPIKPDKKSKLYQIELAAAQIYDLLTNNDAFLFELKNQPVTTGDKESSQK